MLQSLLVGESGLRLTEDGYRTIWTHLKLQDLGEMVRADVHKSIGTLFDQQETPRRHLVDPWECPVVGYTAAICVVMLLSSAAAGCRKSDTVHP